MPGLNALQEKLGDALGLAMAAHAATRQVERIVEGDDALVETLVAMRDDAAHTIDRCARVAAGFGDETRWEIQAHAVYVQRKAGEMTNAWIKLGTDAVEAFSFLAMGEAGEVAVWIALGTLNGTFDTEVAELVEWALPIQERHLQAALEGVVHASQRRAPTALPSL